MTFLQGIDAAVFSLVNQTLTNPVLDAVMPFVTSQRNFYPVFLALFAWLVGWGRPRGRVAAGATIVAVTATDLLCSKLLKHLFGRPRPFQVEEGVRQLVGASLNTAMPSSHAANSFAAATVLTLFFARRVDGRLRVWVPVFAFGFAVLSAWSRVYCGVHYPADVLVGAVLGVLAGWGAHAAAVRLFPWWVAGRRGTGA
jgi:undecaprenyl-diphosphatase